MTQKVEFISLEYQDYDGEQAKSPEVSPEALS